MPNAPILAYVDPGSGHLILQVIGAFFLGSLFYVKRAWAWVRGRRAPKAPNAENAPPQKKASGQ